MSKPLSKPVPKTEKAKSPQRLPPHADYSDVVTDDHIARIKTLVPDSDYADAEIVSGPAWPKW